MVISMQPYDWRQWWRSCSSIPVFSSYRYVCYGTKLLFIFNASNDRYLNIAGSQRGLVVDRLFLLTELITKLVQTAPSRLKDYNERSPAHHLLSHSNNQHLQIGIELIPIIWFSLEKILRHARTKLYN
ncbi:MAG: hypothetical protein ACI88A_004992 [Paraglaciecola sp.]|jgi:hypothetical protein